jgi:hypothetical protein
MGLGRDILILMGVLPLGIPNFDKNKTTEKTNYEKLEELIGKDVSIKDYHHKEYITGNLRCINDSNSYSIYTDKEIKRLFIHDLELVA